MTPDFVTPLEMDHYDIVAQAVAEKGFTACILGENLHFYQWQNAFI